MSLVLKSQLPFLCASYLPTPSLSFLTCNTRTVRLREGLNEMAHAVLAEELAHNTCSSTVCAFLSSLIVIGM